MKNTLGAAAAALVVAVSGFGAHAQTAASQTTPPPAQAASSATAAPASDPTTSPHGQIIQRVLVKVNGEIFTQRDLEEAQIDALQQMNRQVSNPQDLQSDATLVKLLTDVTPAILVRAIDDLILLQRAHELGYKVTEQQYKDAIEGIKKDNKITDDAVFMKALTDQGMTMEQLRQQIEHTALLQMITTQDIMSHVAMTEEEARQYYDKHQSEFLTPPSVTLREILVLSAAPSTGASALSFTATSDAASKAKIQGALDRVKAGEDFAKVATEMSDAPSKARGGLLTSVNLDDLASVVHDAIAATKVGDVTDVIKTQRGYQIFKVEGKTSQTVKPFDTVHQDIMQKIFDQRRDVETKKYVERLRSQALIVWKDDNLKQLYESRVKPK